MMFTVISFPLIAVIVRLTVCVRVPMPGMNSLYWINTRSFTARSVTAASVSTCAPLVTTAPEIVKAAPGGLVVENAGR